MTEGLQATPYIIACYGLAATFILGFGAWNIMQNRKLKLLKQAIRSRRD